MNEIILKIHNEDEMIKLGTSLMFLYKPSLVITMTGDLGAGKTTLTKGIGLALGVKRIINSPTFTIMKIYDTNNSIGIDKLYHLDVYRLLDSSDDFQLEEYFYLDGLTVIEWADIIKDLIPDYHIGVNIERLNEEERKLTLEIPDELMVLKPKERLEGEGYETIN